MFPLIQNKTCWSAIVNLVAFFALLALGVATLPNGVHNTPETWATLAGFVLAGMLGGSLYAWSSGPINAEAYDFQVVTLGKLAELLGKMTDGERVTLSPLPSEPVSRDGYDYHLVETKHPGVSHIGTIIIKVPTGEPLKLPRITVAAPRQVVLA